MSFHPNRTACQCEERPHAVHPEDHAQSECGRRALIVLYRQDGLDTTGTPLCGTCADRALASEEVPWDVYPPV